MRTSTALLHKKQSSTCKKHACGCFLYAPCIYSAYLKKGSYYITAGCAKGGMVVLLKNLYNQGIANLLNFSQSSEIFSMIIFFSTLPEI